MNFNELGLSPELLQAITDTGYTTPTPIQEQAIPIVAQGRDVLGCAQTGTGKTASFALPMIDKLAAGRSRARMPRSLILEPTRELATQVEAAFERYVKHHRLSTALLIGGESFGDQLKKLDRGVEVLIATPGGIVDLFGAGNARVAGGNRRAIDRRCRAGRQARGSTPPDRQRRRQERADLLQPQARRRYPAALADPARVRRGRAARRYVAAEADRDARALQEQR